MSFDSLMNLTCSIQVKTITQDAMGQKVETWADTLTGVACRLDPKGAGKITVPAAIYDAASHSLFMRNPTAITLSTKNHRIIINTRNMRYF